MIEKYRYLSRANPAKCRRRRVSQFGNRWALLDPRRSRSRAICNRPYDITLGAAAETLIWKSENSDFFRNFYKISRFFPPDLIGSFFSHKFWYTAEKLERLRFCELYMNMSTTSLRRHFSKKQAINIEVGYKLSSEFRVARSMRSGGVVDDHFINEVRTCTLIINEEHKCYLHITSQTPMFLFGFWKSIKKYKITRGVQNWFSSNWKTCYSPTVRIVRDKWVKVIDFNRV